LTLAWDKLY